MINKFIDRDKELETLLRIYREERSSLVIVYGRRRIGKTELINQFIKGKRSAYYIATKASSNEQMQKISAIIGEALGDRSLEKFGATGWEMMFDRIKAYKGSGKAIIAIDEFPYLASTDSAISSIFQAGWDQYMSKANVMLILSGSSISMMHNEVLNYSAPLYGRSSAIISMKPMPFKSVLELMPKEAPFEDKLYTYFVFGGVPFYYRLVRGNSVSAVVSDILDNGGIFLDEAALLLSEEVRNDSKYMEVLSAIANGINKPSEIASKLGIFQSNLGRYLSLLEKIGLVRKEYPVSTNPLRMAKGGVYVISDPYIYFWASSLNRYRELIELGSYEAKELIASSIRTGIAQKRFEDFSRELIVHLSNANNALLFPMTRIGRWWGRNPEKPKGMNEEEIDVVAINENTKDILFAECKWTNEKVGVDLYNGLKRKAKLVQWNNGKRKERYALFSKSGFTEEMKAFAQKDNVLLFDLEAIERAVE